MINGVTAVK